MAVIAGNEDYKTPVTVVGYPREERNSDGEWTLYDRFQILEDYVYGFIPAHLSFYEGTSKRLRNTKIDPGDAPGLVVVTLYYAVFDNGAGDSISTNSGKEPNRNCRGDWREIPIKDERLISSGFIANEAARDEMVTNGKVTMGIGGVEYVYEEYITDFVWSQANIIPTNIGKTAAPPGLTGATASLWLASSSDIFQDGTDTSGSPVTVKRTTYRYSAIGWDND